MEKRTATLGDALRNINQEIKFTYLGDDYDTLEILSDHDKPTKEAIESARVVAQKEIDDSYYQIQRLEKYPIEHDLLIALWEKVVEGRSESADALEVERQGVKTAHPKPK
jgi:hypothetical protein